MSILIKFNNLIIVLEGKKSYIFDNEKGERQQKCLPRIILIELGDYKIV